MSPVVPPSLMFQFVPGIPCVTDLPAKRGDLLKLPASAEIFVPAGLNGESHPFRVWAAWNREGLGLQILVSGRNQPFRPASLKNPGRDCVVLSIDTRPTTNVHRLTTWCTGVWVVLSDSENKNSPSIGHRNLGPAEGLRDVSTGARSGMDCQVQLDRENDSYRLQIWVPGSAINGFAEAPEIGRIGLNCLIIDDELGSMPLNLSGDFPVGIDPSTWLTLELLP